MKTMKTITEESQERRVYKTPLTFNTTKVERRFPRVKVTSSTYEVTALPNVESFIYTFSLEGSSTTHKLCPTTLEYISCQTPAPSRVWTAIVRRNTKTKKVEMELYTRDSRMGCRAGPLAPSQVPALIIQAIRERCPALFNYLEVWLEDAS